MDHQQSNLALFARFPTAGHSKTRLIPLLGSDGASSFARAALTDTLHHFSTVPSCRKILFYTPAAAHCHVRRLLKDESLDAAWSVHPQIDSEDLGARLADAVGVLSRLDDDDNNNGKSNNNNNNNPCIKPRPTPVTLMGMDCFDLTISMVRESMDIVAGSLGLAHLIPAVDGGYVLLTVPGECSRDVVFGDIPWSCERTGRVQLQRIEEAGLQCKVGGMLGDVDEPGDLEALWAAREEKRRVFPRVFGFLEGVMGR